MLPSTRRREVWLVDDSPIDLERARRALAPLYSVRAFGDGSTMLEQLTPEVRPDVLVVDWVMEGVSGVDVCSYLKSAPPPLCNIPVLLLTSHNEVAQLVEGFEAGASDYVTKPYADEALQARVRALIRQRELLERAEKAEADVRRLLSAAPDALFVVDAQGRIVFANDEAVRISGRGEEGLLGTLAVEAFPGLALRNISIGPGESLLPLPDIHLGGRIFSPSIRLLPSDSAAATTIALRDITERRRTEERRLDFYSMIAHDLRTPLSAMLLRTDMILRGKHGILRPELAADLRKIAQNARSLVAMINDFLDLARLEGTGYKIDREPLEISAFLRTLCEDFKPLFDAGKIQWNNDIGESEARILGDRRRLAQVMTNLVGNAVKFTPPGGAITTRLLEFGDWVEVQVQDTGPGIDPGVAPRLFERYERAQDGHATSGMAGTGLGLMIVREVVQAHGGEVGVNSRIGEGSTFWFRLRKVTGESGPLLDERGQGARIV